jgi:hypothetical protein
VTGIDVPSAKNLLHPAAAKASPRITLVSYGGVEKRYICKPGTPLPAPA